MYEEFDASLGAYVVRDAQNIVREVSHRTRPFETDVRTPQQAARAYLHAHRDLFEVKPEEMDNISTSPEEDPIDTRVEYRMLGEKRFSDLTTVSYHQTYFGLPVWRSGLGINVKHNPLRVISSTSTVHRDVQAEKPSEQAVKRFQEVRPEDLQAILGLRAGESGEEERLRSLRVNRRRYIVYRYESAQRFAKPPHRPSREDKAFQCKPPSLPVPPVADVIEEGRHYVAAEILFTLEVARSSLNWIAIVEVETASVMYLRALVDSVSGMVFRTDPITQGGADFPGASSTNLNQWRTSETLEDLITKANSHCLSGPYVEVANVEWPNIASPSEVVGNDFDYDVRTDNFAAVNAYYHCDRFFRLVEDLGISVKDYFDGTSFPVYVDHRGRRDSVNGIEINAECAGNAFSSGIGGVNFMLADLSNTTNPVGIACAWRVVLHELGGHGILWDWLESAYFEFAHSAGDSFAAILNDPDSQAGDRFETYPWCGIPRRHDRAVTGGWAWGGTHDDDSDPYKQEQILSTTLFRIYQSIGGDSPLLEVRRFAADYVAYLILRAVCTLSWATNRNSAEAFSSALMAADAADWTRKGHAGGAYRKVIRWAFEQQGAYKPAHALNQDTTGAPEDVDVYIDDGRAGEYQYIMNYWSCKNIWNRLSPDDGTSKGTIHQQPVVGVSNYAYVKIKNRGTKAATNVVVRAFHCRPNAGLIWPNDWQAMSTSQLSVAKVLPDNKREVIVGPFEWIPLGGFDGMLMIVSAEGDASNIEGMSPGWPIPIWRLVPHDNNIGLRNVFPVPGDNEGLLESFSLKRLFVRNPLREGAHIEVVTTLPPLLVDRGWDVVFKNPGGCAFFLYPGEDWQIEVALKAGEEFSPQDVEQTGDRTIHFEVLANGIHVGGMSYEMHTAEQQNARAVRGKG